MKKVSLEGLKKERRSFDGELKGKDLVGAEIGVYQGEHAWGMLSIASIKKLYLVDPYYYVLDKITINIQSSPIQGIPINESKILEGKEALEFLRKYRIKVYFVGGKVLLEDMLTAKKQARELLKNYNVKWLYMKSMEAVEKIKDESLDFVYIDADHSYEFVKDDIEYWTKKVKKGGLVGGDDYNPGKEGVIRAVDEYCQKNKINCEVVSGNWWFRR